MLTGVDIPRRHFPRMASLSISYLFRYILTGWPFALSMMGILFAHEMGHYIMCRYYKVPATLPFFLPAPLLSPLGTLGAFIMMRGIPKNKRLLFDVGIAGPIAGLVIAIPVLFIGLSISHLGPIGHARSRYFRFSGRQFDVLFIFEICGFGKLLPEPVSMDGLSPCHILAAIFLNGQPIPFSGMDVSFIMWHWLAGQACLSPRSILSRLARWMADTLPMACLVKRRAGSFRLPSAR